MRIPNSKAIKWPLIISLVVLLAITLYIIAVQLLFQGITSRLDLEPMDEEMKLNVYQRSKNLINDLFQEDPEYVFEEYVFSAIKEQGGTHNYWRNTHRRIMENDLMEILEFGEHSFSTRVRLGADEPIRYVVELQVILDIDDRTRETTVEIEWVEDEDLSLYLLKFPVHFNPIPFVGPVEVVFGEN